VVKQEFSESEYMAVLKGEIEVDWNMVMCADEAISKMDLCRMKVLA